MEKIGLTLQTMFTELIQQCLDAGFDQDFDEQGHFVKVKSKSREYWYYQRYHDGGRTRSYVGPVAETEITDRVETFKQLKSDFSRRRDMVRALTQVLPQTDDLTGSVLEALWKAGFFRLRGVLIGTAAFQAYAGLLGVKLPKTSVMTQDVDLAQFKAISDHVDDTVPPMIEILQTVDDSFQALPELDPVATTAYANHDKYRVEFLTPNRGSDMHQSKPAKMPALGGADATPLRFLDYLIHEPVWSVLLYRGGIPVRVPHPARFAIHKLIVSTRRKSKDFAKGDKDLYQSSILIQALANRRLFELGEALYDAEQSGPKWKAAIARAILNLDSNTQDFLAQARESYGLAT